MDTKTLVKRLRYQGRQYQQGQVARGGDGDKHILTQAADTIDGLAAMVEGLLKVGGRMAMALTDAQSGYVCEYRMAWEDLINKTPPQALNAIRAEVAIESHMAGQSDAGVDPSYSSAHQYARKYKEE